MYIQKLINEALSFHHAAIALVKARKDVNAKVRALRSDIIESEMQLQKYYEPLVKPFKQFIGKANMEIKNEPAETRKQLKHYG